MRSKYSIGDRFYEAAHPEWQYQVVEISKEDCTYKVVEAPDHCSGDIGRIIPLEWKTLLKLTIPYMDGLDRILEKI